MVPLSGGLGFFISLLKSLFSIFTLPCGLSLELLAWYAGQFEIEGNEMGPRDSSEDREELALESMASDVHTFRDLRNVIVNAKEDMGW